MRVDVERQPNIAVPGQGLGHLGADAGALETGDEQVPTRMEIGKASSVVWRRPGSRISRVPPDPEVTRLP